MFFSDWVKLTLKRTPKDNNNCFWWVEEKKHKIQTEQYFQLNKENIAVFEVRKINLFA